jgi:ASC-1-like (ASCH) protein
MIHQMGLQSHPYNKIKSGEKIIEVRLFDEKRRAIKIGDVIEFGLDPERVEKMRVEVVALLNYKTFSKLIDDFPISYFGRESKEELLERLYSFYTKEDEDKYTVVGIKLRLIQ